jgi:hypothetical protein
MFLHLHNFNKPIVSKYLNFHERKIVYQCRCGKRKAKRVFRTFSDSFPIETTPLMTNDEVLKVVNEGREKDFKTRLTAWFFDIFKIVPCKVCGSWDTAKGYYSSGWNNYCNQASGDHGRICKECLHVEFDEPFEVRLKKKPDWITLLD